MAPNEDYYMFKEESRITCEMFGQDRHNSVQYSSRDPNYASTGVGIPVGNMLLKFTSDLHSAYFSNKNF